MSESTLREQLVDALRTAQWDSESPRRHHAHGEHNYHWLCGICRGDVDAIADALVPVVEAALAEQATRKDSFRVRAEAKPDATSGRTINSKLTVPGLHDQLVNTLQRHTEATALPTPFPSDLPKGAWLEAARRANEARADALLPVVEAAIERARASCCEDGERTYGEMERHLTERAEQAERERDLAIAHDRQPYPTAWAYEQACKALEKHRARADRAEAAVQRVRNLAAEALTGWEPEHAYHQERAKRKGYSHDEAAAEAYGRAIEAVTEILAALGQPEETP